MKSVEKLKKEILESRLLFLLIVLGIIANLATVFLDIKNVSINDRILFITFLALVWYAVETQGLKKEAIKQTEIEQKPVMMLYVRNRSNITDKMEKVFKREYTIIDDLSYYLSLRNVGRGPAFNVEVIEIKDKDSIFVVEKYQCRFFAPKGDEQAIKFIKKDNSKDNSKIKKDNSKIKSYDELKNIIFKISCKGVDGRLHAFQYKIIDIEKQEVEYLDK